MAGKGRDSHVHGEQRAAGINQRDHHNFSLRRIRCHQRRVRLSFFVKNPLPLQPSHERAIKTLTTGGICDMKRTDTRSRGLSKKKEGKNNGNDTSLVWQPV